MLFIQPDKTISNVELQGVSGYLVEGELEEKIRANYPCFDFVTNKDGALTDIIPTEPPEPIITEADIDRQVVAKIRERYDINDECKMLRFGITDPENDEFLAYNAFVEECRAWGKGQKEQL